MIALKTVFLHFNAITVVYQMSLTPLTHTLAGSAEKDFHVYLVFKQAFPLNKLHQPGKKNIQQLAVMCITKSETLRQFTQPQI